MSKVQGTGPAAAGESEQALSQREAAAEVPLPAVRRAPWLLTQWANVAGTFDVIDCLRGRVFRVNLACLEVLTSLSRWIPEAQIQRRLPGETFHRLSGAGLLQWWKEGPHPPPVAVPCNLHRVLRDEVPLPGGHRDDQGPPPTPTRPPAVAPLPVPSFSLGWSLEEVLQRRRSERAYGDDRVAGNAVAALLYHAARTHHQEWHATLGYHVFRPYPTAGARGELEIYLIVNDVAPLEPGAYYYDPDAHGVVFLGDRPEDRNSFTATAIAAMGNFTEKPIPLLLVVTAVHERTLWKYGIGGVVLIHRDVGALYQTLYLVATALGLAPCAMGTMPSGELSSWLRLDPEREVPVGAFAIGSRLNGVTGLGKERPCRAAG